MEQQLDPGRARLVGLDPVVLVADQAGQDGPRPDPALANSHDDGAATTPAARTGLHSYIAPSRRLSGSFSGGRRQSVVTSDGSVRQAGSSPTDHGL